jgi:hypothetical protein
MPTELQIQASRTNGAKSRGPITPEGKEASSQNAITHGMLADTVVLKDECPDRFLELLRALHEERQPQPGIEASLVENMAVARWRQMRLWGMEKAAMDHETDKRSEAWGSSEGHATRAALAFRALSDDSRSLDLINRYESRYDRQYLRAHRRFLELQDRRTPPHVPEPAPPAPVPVSTPPPAPPQTETTDSAKRTREPQPAPPGTTIKSAIQRRRTPRRRRPQASVRTRFARFPHTNLRYSGTLTAGTLINDAR